MTLHRRLAGSFASAALAAAALGVSAPTALAHDGQHDRSRGAAQHHELMMSENPGMARMHELHMQGNPGMATTHEQTMGSGS